MKSDVDFRMTETNAVVVWHSSIAVVVRHSSITSAIFSSIAKELPVSATAQI
jgi:hypothetical protein